jgi:cellulose biosynthesis protein BcsQ
MLTVAVLQQKGGSEKTTIAVNLAAAAHLEGGRTLVDDMDRQASALDWSPPRQEGSSLDGLAVVKADIVADVPEHTHRQVRVRCFERGVLVRDYSLELLARDGIK